MTTVYKFDISHATLGPALHVLREDILADETLDIAEKNELLELIQLKFGALNARAVGPQKARWD